MSKAEIKAKFRTLRNFAVCAGLPVMKVYDELKKNGGADLMELVRTTELNEADRYITTQEREALDMYIRVNYRTQRAFCQAKGLSPVLVNSIITGRATVKNDSVKRVLSLCV